MSNRNKTGHFEVEEITLYSELMTFIKVELFAVGREEIGPAYAPKFNATEYLNVMVLVQNCENILYIEIGIF